MKTFASILLLSCSLAFCQTKVQVGGSVNKGTVCPQVEQWDLTFTASGQAIDIPNSCVAQSLALSEDITGSPSAMSIVVTGCLRGVAACSTLDTNTATTSQQRAPNVDKPYEYFLVTATWTGGGVTVKIHSTTSPFAKRGGSALTGADPIEVSGGVISCPTCGTGTGNVATTGSITSGQLPIWQDATHLKAVTPSGDGTINSGGVMTINPGVITDAKGALAVKPSVTLVAVSNLTLSGVQTIDGVTGTAAQTIVLTTNQNTGSQNGPWIMQTGAWTRPTWYAAGSTTQAIPFSTTLVRLGNTYQGSTWRMTTTSAVTVDTDATTWVETPYNLADSNLVGRLSRTHIDNAAVFTDQQAIFQPSAQQIHQCDSNGCSLVLPFIVNAPGATTTPGTIMIFASAVDGSPHAGFFTGDFFQIMFNVDNDVCQLSHNCTGDIGSPAVKRDNATMNNLFAHNLTADKITVQQDHGDVLSFGPGSINTTCTESAAASLVFVCIDVSTPSSPFLKMSYNDSPSKILRAADSITSSQLPTPTSTTIGGVKSKASSSNQFLTAIGTDGTISSAQPSFSNLSGSATAAQLPNPTSSTIGGVKSLTSVSHQFLTSIGTDGTPTQAQPTSSDVSGLVASATTDTTNANNISSGTLPAARLPNFAIPLLGLCAGTVGTANSTAYVFFPFQNSISTCTATAVGTAGGSAASNNEMLLPVAGTAKLLSANAGTACTSSGSAVKVYKNSVATSLLVTGLTANNTWVTDSSDTVSFSANDTISVRIVTGQATETCANLRFTLIINPS